MPIIIDANRAGDFCHPFSMHAPEILRRIAEKRTRVTVGGKLLHELSQTRIKQLLLEWARSGRLDRQNDEHVNAETERFASTNLSSDDPHIIALAYISGCRLLYTEDSALIIDFKNTSIISPKGKVIKTNTKNKCAITLLDRLGQ
jgi:predicted nucleic acid-binding protein